MSQPLQLVLGEHGLNISAGGVCKYFSVRHTITSCNSKNALKAAYVEAFQGPDVAAVGHPSFTAIKEGCYAHSLLQNNLCGEMKVLVLEDSAPESPKCS